MIEILSRRIGANPFHVCLTFRRLQLRPRLTPPFSTFSRSSIINRFRGRGVSLCVCVSVSVRVCERESKYVCGYVSVVLSTVLITSLSLFIALF